MSYSWRYYKVTQHPVAVYVWGAHNIHLIKYSSFVQCGSSIPDNFPFPANFWPKTLSIKSGEKLEKKKLGGSDGPDRPVLDYRALLPYSD